jgi:hypothetical protein
MQHATDLPRLLDLVQESVLQKRACHDKAACRSRMTYLPKGQVQYWHVLHEAHTLTPRGGLKHKPSFIQDNAQCPTPHGGLD